MLNQKDVLTINDNASISDIKLGQLKALIENTLMQLEELQASNIPNIKMFYLMNLRNTHQLLTIANDIAYDMQEPNTNIIRLTQEELNKIHNSQE